MYFKFLLNPTTNYLLEPAMILFNLSYQLPTHLLFYVTAGKMLARN
jgi:hypothetical protein